MEQRFGNSDSRIECAAQRFDGGFRHCAKTCCRNRTADQCGDQRNQLLGRGNAPFALSGKDHAENVLKILCVGSGQHGGVETRRL